MSKEGNGRLIVEKAEEIEKDIKELIGKISLVGIGFEILITGLRKTAFSVVNNITQGISEFQNEKCVEYLQKSLSQLKALEYYNYISRKVGYFSSTPYLQLKEKIKDMREHLYLSVKSLKLQERDGFFSSSKRMNNQSGFENKEEAELKLSPQDPGR